MQTRNKFIDALMPHALVASQRTGIDPRIIIAQSAQETGWGRSAPGNNYFGIKSHSKGGGQTFTTHEYINGQRVKINDSFRQYGGIGDSVQGYADFMLENPRYRPMREAEGLDAQLAALGASGYATDPNYASSVGSIARSIALDGLPGTGPASPVRQAANQIPTQARPGLPGTAMAYTDPKPAQPSMPAFQAIMSGNSNTPQSGQARMQTPNEGQGRMPRTVSTTLPVSEKEIARRRAYADAMTRDASKARVIRHPLQGFAQLADTAVAGFAGRQADRMERERNAALTQAVGGLDPTQNISQEQIARIAAVSPEMGMRLYGAAVQRADADRQRLAAEESARNEFSVTSIYDQETGREQKGRLYKDGRFVPMGGVKSDTISPEAEAQKARIAEAGATQTNVTVGGKEQDKDYAPRFNDWALGGSADAARQIAQLDSVIDVLQSGEANVTGPFQGAMPNFLRSVVNPQGQAMKDRVEEVVQRSLRTILGAQFTEKEGDRLIARAYNPSLGEEENAKRLTALVTQLRTMKEAQDSAAEYFRQNNTLDGWQGRLPQISDFAVFGDEEAAPDGKEVPPTGNGGTTSGGIRWSVE